MDLISRQAAIDAIEKLNIPEDMCVFEILSHIELAISTLPSVEPKTFTVIDTKTGREADTYNIALKEEWAKGLCYCDIDMFVIGEDGTLMLIDDCGNCAYYPQGRFEVKWNE